MPVLRLLAAAALALGGKAPLDQQPHRLACRDGRFGRMGREIGMELGAGGFQLRAVVEHCVGLPALHVSVQLLCVVGGGGRLHGDEELHVHGVHLVFLF